jgi:hypothetical protein
MPNNFTVAECSVAGKSKLFNTLAWEISGREIMKQQFT